MLTYTETTVFNVGAQTIVNTINCVGVMGAGLALEFQLRFPAMEQDYAERCKQRRVVPGKPYIYKGYENPLILNFPTKNHWKHPSKLEWIQQGLEYFSARYKKGNVTSIAFPKLGCDRGGLDWNQVSPLMERYLRNLDIDVYICLDQETKASGIEGVMVDLINNDRIFSWASELDIRSDIVSKVASALPLNRFRELRRLEGVGKQTYNEVFRFLYNAALKLNAPTEVGLNLSRSLSLETPNNFRNTKVPAIKQEELPLILRAKEEESISDDHPYKVETVYSENSVRLDADKQLNGSELGLETRSSYDAFYILLPYIENALMEERTQDELAKMFSLPKKLTGDWLSKAIELGRVKKLSRPSRYISTSKLAHRQLECELATQNSSANL